MSSLPSSADVVIVGGGVVGSFAALELARRGLRPVLLEKEEVGAEQSSKNWGFVRQQGRADPEIPLMVAANAAWSGFEDRYGEDIGWRQRGNLRLIREEADLRWYREWAARGAAQGVPVELVDDQRLRQLLPGAQGRWVGAMFTANDGQADPTRAVHAVARAAERAGALIRSGSRVDTIRARHGRIVGVETDQGAISTETVVVAAGVWSRRLLAPLGVNLPMQWIRATVAETAPVDGFEEIPAVWDAKVAFRKTEAGGLVFAASGRTDVDLTLASFNNLRLFAPTLVKNLRSFRVRVGTSLWRDAVGRLKNADARPNPRTVRRSFADLQAIFPVLRGTTIDRSWAAYIDGTPDNLPVLSRVPPVDGLVVGAGFSGHGFGLAPVSGAVLADLATVGRCEEHDISAFRLARFAEPGYRVELSLGR